MSDERMAEIRSGRAPHNHAGQAERDVRELLGLYDEMRECSRANSASARKLMDAIRDDPAFPPEDEPLLFGERALAVINRLRARVAELEGQVQRVEDLIRLEDGFWLPSGTRLLRVAQRNDITRVEKKITVVPLDALRDALDGSDPQP